MYQIALPENFSEWRKTARRLLQAQLHPSQVLWQKHSLFDTQLPDSTSPTTIVVPKAFFELAETVACHSNEQRWDLLYQLLWRLCVDQEKHLLAMSADPLVRKINVLAKQVRREIHKTHAFIRFRKVGATPEGREYFVAWFEPEHRILEPASSFFVKRFHNMDWSICTPYCSAHWFNNKLRFTHGYAQDPFPTEDRLETLWQTYYRNIFNPARLKLQAMQNEMPKRYWKNLPEASLITELTRSSQLRTQQMLDTPERESRHFEHPYLQFLQALNPVDCPGSSAETPHA